MQIAFVCTGNICRSPMAEAIATASFANGEHEFVSAGTYALVSRPMTSTASDALAEIGITPGDGRAARVDDGLVSAADRIYVMEPQHVAWIVRRWPDAADKVALLDPEGEPVADPYGRSLGVYRAVRDHINAVIGIRAIEWSDETVGRDLE